MSRSLLLVTVSDDRSGRKGGLYEVTQKKICNIFNNNNFGLEGYHFTIEAVLKSEFYKQNKTMLDDIDAAKNGRLYKPYVILEALKTLSDGDFLIYSDCSPEMWTMDENWIIDQNIFDLQVIKDLTLKNRDFLVAFVKWDSKFIPNGGLGIHTHNNFTLDNCIAKMNGENYRHSFQCASGMICMRKTETTIKIIEDWLHFNRMPECSCMNVDDTENSYFDGKPGTKLGNRHDQGILSLLLNQRNYDYVDILYNDISPYNFLNFCRRGIDYNFINSNTKP